MAQYKAQKGDTLSAIALTYYANAQAARCLARFNKPDRQRHAPTGPGDRHPPYPVPVHTCGA